jgi:hypothetical protein
MLSPSKTAKLQQKAVKLHTHVVVFKKGSEEERCAIKAMSGKSTKRIAHEMGLTESMVQYRIKKSQDRCGVKFRNEYRNGGGFSDKAEEAIADYASRRIQQYVASVYVPMAASRINQ